MLAAAVRVAAGLGARSVPAGGRCWGSAPLRWVVGLFMLASLLGVVTVHDSGISDLASFLLFLSQHKLTPSPLDSPGMVLQ